MSRKFTLATITALLVLALAVTAVAAIVTFDPATGTGFAGKGDVQLALGWNNATLQKNAGSLGFSYNYVQVAYQDCELDLGRITVEATLHRVQLVHDVVQYDARTHKQVDGFNLVGYGDLNVYGALPTCPSLATPVGDVYYSDPMFAQLDVNYGGTYVQLWAQ